VCKIVGTVLIGFAGQRPLASTLSINRYLRSPAPWAPTLNPSSSRSKLDSDRKPEPSVPVRLLVRVLPGSTVPWTVRSQANMYLTGIMKIEKYKVQHFENIFFPHIKGLIDFLLNFGPSRS